MDYIEQYNGPWIVIPDVHGRSFWSNAVSQRKTEKIIFLGDYLDPYPWEEIDAVDATIGLKSVLDFKKEHPDDVVLLLGNHDLGYLDRNVCECRMDYYGESVNRKLILDNIALFKIVHMCKVGERNVLFSHAGVRNEWVAYNRQIFGDGHFDPLVLNDMLHDDSRCQDLLMALGQCSPYRGGCNPASSPVWADVNELEDSNDFLSGYMHVFGHTLHEGGPIHVASQGWCLDCATAFNMTESCEFLPIF